MTEGTPIPRAEALRISRETIETAERERGEIAEREAAAGVNFDAPSTGQFMNYHSEETTADVNFDAPIEVK